MKILNRMPKVGDVYYVDSRFGDRTVEIVSVRGHQVALKYSNETDVDKDMWELYYSWRWLYNGWAKTWEKIDDHSQQD